MEHNFRILWAFRKEISSRNIIFAEGGGAKYIDFSHKGIVGQMRYWSIKNEPLDRINEDAIEDLGEWYAVFTFSFYYMLFLEMIKTNWR